MSISLGETFTSNFYFSMNIFLNMPPAKLYEVIGESEFYENN